MIQLLMFIVPIALIIFALVDLITSDDYQVKHLPKMAWLFVIILLPVVGSIVWLLVGKDRGRVLSAENVSFGDPRRHSAVEAAASSRPLSTEEELAAIDREIAFHENEARIRRLEAQVEAKRAARS